MKRMKKKFFNMVRFYIKHCIRPISSLIMFITPYVAIYSASEEVQRTGSLYETFIIATCLVVISIILRIMSDALNVSDYFPVPYKRFTVEDEYDGITVEKEDMPDMISYVCDVENFLERKGIV